MSGTEVTVELLDPDSDDVGQRKLVAFGLSLIFYLVAMLFGMQIAQSVVAEKESRVVEILAAAIPTRALLWGKIAGNTLLALGQVVILVGGGLVIFAVLGNETMLSGVGPAMVWFIAFFALGFIALAALWSAAGALASRVQDIASHDDAAPDPAARRLHARRLRRRDRARHRLPDPGAVRDRDAGTSGLRRCRAVGDPALARTQRRGGRAARPARSPDL